MAEIRTSREHQHDRPTTMKRYLDHEIGFQSPPARR